MLSSNEDILANKNKGKVNIVSIVDFLKRQNSNLLDFVGFSCANTFFSKEIYPEHLSFTETSQKIRQGLLFEGKFMAEKSYFKLANQIIKLNLKNNRALFGDVVAIELDPR